jgi:uncharacterized protein YdgA (DUF945 family)
MKKIVIVAVVLVLVLVAGPWAIGRLAEKRVNEGLDKMLQQAPYLTIVERKWTGGWFRSEQEVTFEIFAGWLDALSRKPAVETDNAAVESGETPEEELARRQQSAVPGTEAAVEDPAPEEVPAAAQAGPEAVKPIRFTVRNEILHGPVLWPASLGLARVNSKLVLSEEIRNKLVETFGTDEPMRISSRVGFFGGGSTRFYGEGRKLEFKDKGGVMNYDDFEVEVGYSKSLEDFEMEGSWDKFEYTDNNSGEALVFSGMSLEGESERIVGDLFETDAEFKIEKMLFTGGDKTETGIEDVHYVVDTSHKDGFIDMSARFGSGKVSNPAFEQQQLEVKEIHYDFTVRHLHVETLDKLMTALKASYAQPVATAADVDAAILTPLQEHGMALLKHDPELAIDRIGIVTADGDGVIKGVLRLEGVTEADFPLAMGGLVNKLVADINIAVAQKLLEKLPNGATGAGMAVDQGFAKREADQLVSRIEFSKGELRVNGKPLPIPGLGGPPAGQGEEPLPQE